MFVLFFLLSQTHPRSLTGRHQQHSRALQRPVTAEGHQNVTLDKCLAAFQEKCWGFFVNRLTDTHKHADSCCVFGQMFIFNL